MNTIDGKQVEVGTRKRAKCNYCYGNGTSTLRRHLEDLCKIYPGRVDLEKGRQVFTSSDNKAVVMTK